MSHCLKEKEMLSMHHTWVNDFENLNMEMILSDCTDLVPLNTTEGQSPYDIRTFLKQENITIPFTK